MVSHINTSQPQVTSTSGSSLDRVSSQPIGGVQRVEPKRERDQQAEERQQPFGKGNRRGQLAETSARHQQVAHAESAAQALKEAVNMLEQLRQLGRRTLQAREGEKQQLQQSLGHMKNRLAKLSKEAQYDGEPLLFHDLSPRLRGDSQQTGFTVKGLRLNGWRNQDEVLRFQFDSGQPSSVRARVSWEDAPRDVAESLNKALASRDIQVGLDKYGELSFSVDKSRWSEVKGGIWVSGSGQILPAGNPIKAKVETTDKASPDIEALDFNKPESVRKALGDIERVLQSVRHSLQALDDKQKQLDADLAQTAFTKPVTSTMVTDSGALSATWFNLPEGITLQLVSNAVPTLLAQANATRHNVVALLE
ncbi:hypothetical protein LRP50_10545 [Enterovibrio sp. ZSDZ42]|uniref:Flagellin n=1 Tax=Enterovibrio gelatinilyticus TaxID=2899819 RepID=A0ABT5QZW9_9GAMM|nr:hypothetical protein [Enterovibrio sp. ZSDZ42]MDD1793567.1 hypothetical protein [Enterovibrio sp. ZSDZ42]